MSNVKGTISSIFKTGEVSVKELGQLFWSKRRLLFIPVVIFSIIGIIAAATTPKEFEAKCVLLSDQSTGSASSNTAMQGLASLAGVNLPGGGGSSEGGADLYPIILNNQPFLMELGRDTITTDGINKTTLGEYFKEGEETDLITRIKMNKFHVSRWFSQKRVTPGLPASAANRVDTGNGIFSNAVTVVQPVGSDMQIASILRPRIKLSQTGKTIVLSVKMPEARLSAEATKLVLNKLIRYVTKYKIQKQQETVDFLEARTAEAEINYKTSQQRVAGFKDANYGLIFQSIQSKEQLLQNEFTLSFAIYNQLVTQLEQAKIQLKKDTPLFAVLEPVYIPYGPSESAKIKVFLSYLSLGIGLGILLIVLALIIPFLRRSKQSAL